MSSTIKASGSTSAANSKMADIDTIYEIFSAFCSFGSSRNLAGSAGDLSEPTMDGSKWAKFCRDNQLIAGKVTSTEGPNKLTVVDIVFNKVKAKNSRKIDFKDFQAALKLIAATRYPSNNPTEQFQQIGRHLTHKDSRPIANATATSNDKVTQRLTDTSHYTGTSKARFDDDGNGKGLSGRRDIKHISLSDIADRTQADVRGVNANFKSPEVKTSKAPASKVVPVSVSKRSHTNVATASSDALEKKHVPAKKAEMGSGSVFDRLTDVKGYTSTHKERFNADGSGKGLAGRDTETKISLSNMADRSAANIRGVNLSRS